MPLSGDSPPWRYKAHTSPIRSTPNDGPRHYATPLHGHVTPHHAGPATRATTPYPTPHTPHAEGKDGRTATPRRDSPTGHHAPHGHRTPLKAPIRSEGTHGRPSPQKRKEGPFKRHDGARCAGPLPAAMHHTPCRYTPRGYCSHKRAFTNSMHEPTIYKGFQ